MPNITENIKYSYGRPDSEVGGLKIKKFTGKGQNRKETYGFLVKDWCQYILRDKSCVTKFSSNLFCQCGDVAFQFFVLTI